MPTSFDKMQALVYETSALIKEATGKDVKADVIEDEAAKLLLERMDLNLSEFRVLAGIQPLKPIARSAEEVEKWFTLFGKRITEKQALEWQANQLTNEINRRVTVDVGDLDPKDVPKAFDALHKSLAPVAEITTDVMDAGDFRIKKRSYRSVKGSRTTMKQYLEQAGVLSPDEDSSGSGRSKNIWPPPPPLNIDLAPLGDTTVTIREGGSYRAPGKQAIEELLDEAGLVYKTLVTVNHPDGPEHITPDQLDLITKLNEAHGNITFLHELAQPVNLVVSFPKKEKRLGFFRRLWIGFVLGWVSVMPGAKKPKELQESNDT